ncbi:MAG: hypothetical protein K8U03_05575 [Planctomycetia bacterium]|nr:hypothetical protein [Planctomycetia bacterium]
MIRLLALIAFCSTTALAHAADGPGQLESKLHGTWVGGPCMGTLIVKADGTFERRGYSPGGNRLAGTWKLNWEALPPTLTLNCTESDEVSFVGEKYERRLVELNGDHLGLMYLSEKTAWPEQPFDRSAGEGITRYKRKK